LSQREEEKLSSRSDVYEYVWRTLADFTTALAKKSRRLPPNVVAELRTARSLIHILKTDPEDANLQSEVIPRIETHLRSVEAELASRATALGEDFLSEWMGRLEHAHRQASKVVQVESRISSPRIARDEYWLRIKVTEKSPQKLVREVSSAVGASVKPLNNHHMLVFGDKEQVRSFVKEISKRIRGDRK